MTLRLLLLLLLTIPLSAAEPSMKDLASDVNKRIDGELNSLLALYKHLHANPELSLEEVQTSARLAKELKSLGFDVTEKVGGHGVVGVLKNGEGPTILVRTDMDGLPIIERTGMDYASKVRVRNKDGQEVGTMHACGHDVHMTCWTGTARVLASMKDRWKGTLVFIGQPAEEIGQGAKRMLADGLFKRFPRPDYALALHADGNRPYGTIAYSEGLALANVDTIDIIIRGKGGHGAAPHMTIDPVVIAARLILDLQTLVSREVSPTDPAVVTVGSIHGGTKHNIIPDEVRLQLTVRSTKDSVREHLLKGIERLANAAAEGARAPKPTVKHDLMEWTPAMYNESKLTRKTVGLFREIIGEKNILERQPILGGEDFSRYGREGVPAFMYFLGTSDPKKVEEAQKPGAMPLPSMHSDLYAPVPEPSIRTGVLTLTMAVLNLNAK